MSSVPSWATYLFWFVNILWALIVVMTIVIMANRQKKGRGGYTAYDFKSYEHNGPIHQTLARQRKGEIKHTASNGKTRIYLREGIRGWRPATYDDRDVMWVHGAKLVFIGRAGLLRFIDEADKTRANEAHILAVENEELREQVRKFIQNKEEILKGDVERVKDLAHAAPFLGGQKKSNTVRRQ